MHRRHLERAQVERHRGQTDEEHGSEGECPPHDRSPPEGNHGCRFFSRQRRCGEFLGLFQQSLLLQQEPRRIRKDRIALLAVHQMSHEAVALLPDHFVVEEGGDVLQGRAGLGEGVHLV
jgi:hypothetical protein